MVKRSDLCIKTCSINTASVWNCFGLFSLVNGAWFVHIFLLIQMSNFFSWESNRTVWIDGGRKQWIQVKNVFYKHASFCFTKYEFMGGVVWITSGLLWCFIICLDSHTDGTHSLHWWTSDVMLNFSKIFQWRNKLFLILDGLRVSTFSANFHFGVNYSFKYEQRE